MMTVKVIKPFKACIGGELHPSQFNPGIQSLPNDIAEIALKKSWATMVKQVTKRTKNKSIK